MKKLLISLFIFSFAGALQAQAPTIESIVADYERAKAMTLAYIEAMPEDKFSYRPSEGVRTYAEQMLHTAQGLIGLSANGTGADRIYGNENLEKTEAYQTKSEVRRLTTEIFDFAIESISKMDPSSYQEVVPAGPYQVTRLGWLNKSFEHLTHHRGQCAVYLRMQGITPPKFALF